jgi:DnaD/phage-associated family protein
MADMRFVLPGPDTITISGQTVEKLIRACDGDAALLYLYVLRTGGGASLSQASKTLGRSEREIASSMTLLERLGLLRCDDVAPPVIKDELPEYTADDIKRELENGSVFYSLVQEVQKSLGKILSSDDLMKLFGIYDSLGLPPEVILHLVTHCIDESRRRYGGGRVPTMRYIEKAAYTWEREGIFSLEQAELYLKQLDSRRSAAAEIKKVLQIKDRELTVTERKYVENWISQGFTPEAVELAYDKTVLKTGRLAWSYMDSIMNSWHGKGLHTADEIQQKDGRPSTAEKKTAADKRVKPAAPAPSSADIDRMKKFLDKLREE